MDHRRWIWPVFAAVLLAGAIGWGAWAPGGGDGRRPEESAEWSAGPARARSPAPSVSAQQSPTPPAEPRRVLFLGDSFAVETQDALGARLEKGGQVTYTAETVAGNTVCDYLTGRPSLLVAPEQKAAALVREVRPDLLVLQFRGTAWGWTPCMKGIAPETDAHYRRYASDVAALTREVEQAAKAAGIERPTLLWVLQPTEWDHPALAPAINGVYRTHTAATGDLVADAASVLTGADGQWAGRVPCTPAERADPAYCTDGFARLHRDDDLLHFCLADPVDGGRPCPVPSPGIRRYTEAVAGVVDGWLAELR